MYTIPQKDTYTIEDYKSAVAFNDRLRSRYDKMDRYYLGNHPINSRQKSAILANNQVVVNHAKYITDTYTGYLFGSEIDYRTALEGDPLEVLKRAYRRQSIDTLDSVLGRDCSVFGRAYEYIYADKEGRPTSANIDPRNCVVAYDDTVEHNPLFAVIYSDSRRITNSDETRDDSALFTGGKVLLADRVIEYGEGWTSPEEEAHYFGEIPAVEYRNNQDIKGDFEAVLELIDAYNILQSDRINDKEQLVAAILCLYGFELSEKDQKLVGVNRLMQISDPASRAEYLVKSMMEADIDILRKSIEDNIHKISMTPNLTDEHFVGNSSGVAIKYKLLAFEQATKTKERHFEKGLMERARRYIQFLNVKDGQPLVETHDIDAVFTRSLPQNDFENAQMANLLDGLVSKETLVSQFGFVDNAQDELERVKQERESVRLPEFGTAQDTQNEVDELITTKGVEQTDGLVNKIRNILSGQSQE